MSKLSVAAVFAVAAVFVITRPVPAAGLNPAAIAIKEPKDMKFTRTGSGALESVLYGDPTKPGMYVIFVKWEPNKMSHPHTHPHDRLVTVVSGTWWAGTGTKFDPNSTVPLKAGSFARHYANQPHFDGAKSEGCILEIVGEGPETSTPAETK
jgi:quercetin dioxygenase-like cupin family protein